MIIEDIGGSPEPITPEEWFLDHMFPLRIKTIVERYKRSVRDGTNPGRFVSFSPAPGKDFYFNDIYYEAEYHIERMAGRTIHNNFKVKVYQQYYHEKYVGWWIFKKTVREWFSTELTHEFKSNDFRPHIRGQIDEQLDELIAYDPKDKSLARFLRGTENEG